MPFTVVVCTNGSAMRTRARVRCAGVNFKEWLDEEKKWWYGKHVEGETGFLSDERYPGSYSRFNVFISDSIDQGGGSVKNFH